MINKCIPSALSFLMISLSASLTYIPAKSVTTGRNLPLGSTGQIWELIGWTPPKPPISNLKTLTKIIYISGLQIWPFSCSHLRLLTLLEYTISQPHSVIILTKGRCLMNNTRTTIRGHVRVTYDFEGPWGLEVSHVRQERGVCLTSQSVACGVF